MKLKIKKAPQNLRSWYLFPSLHREKMEAVTDFIFLGSKIIGDNDCSNEIKRHLLLGRKAMTSRNINLWTKFCIVKAMVFLVVMYGCES